MDVVFRRTRSWKPWLYKCSTMFQAQMQNTMIFLVAATVAALSVLGAARKPTSASAGPNPTPFVIPSLQEWTGGDGTWTLSESTRIVVDAKYANGTVDEAQHGFMANPASLMDYATTLQTDLEEVVGRKLSVVTGTQCGVDIFLTLYTGANATSHEEYELEISSGVSVRGATARGAFWGTRTLLQLLIQDDAVPRGKARDWPNYTERKFFQDIARKPIPLSDLREYAVLASFFKMNTLHHHYSDNLALHVNMSTWEGEYSGFRLRAESLPLSMYANNDTSFTRADLRTFQDFIKARGMGLIPEIDTPAHSLAFTKFHPDWTLPNKRKDWLDLGNAAVQPFIESLWTEFAGWFDSREIHIGADEYDHDRGEALRHFVNSMHDFASGLNKTIRMWGSDRALTGPTPINPQVYTDHWHWNYSDPLALVERGHRISNLNSPDVYLVPRTAAFWDYINAQHIYERWEPWVFDSFDRENKSRNLSPGEPLLTGGGFADWNDFGNAAASRVELYDRISRAMGVFGEKTWTGAKNVERVDYAEWAAKFDKLRQRIPGITLNRRPASKDQFVLRYDFDDSAKDTSGNGYDGRSHNVQFMTANDDHKGVAQLSASSHVEIPLQGIFYPYTVAFWIKPSRAQVDGAVLFESDEARVIFRNNTIQLEQDGTRYSTTVQPAIDAWTHVALASDGQHTYCFQNLVRKGSVQWTNPSWYMNMAVEEVAFTFPLATIGSRHGNSFEGQIDGVVVLNRYTITREVDFIAGHTGGFLP